MGRKVDVDKLVSAAEIAERFGAKRSQVVYVWRERHRDFPSPLRHLSTGYVWYWPDVERWGRKTGRLPLRRQERTDGVLPASDLSL